MTYTQCPNCHAIYQLDAATLSAARGRVQCGACELTFDALASLRDELPRGEDRWQNTELPFAAVDTAPGESPAPATGGDEAAEPAPRRAPEAPRREPPADWTPPARGFNRLWLAASLLLVLGLTAQMLFLAPRALANHAGLRPVAEALCGLSGCELPPRRDLQQLRIASRDVRAHPSVPGALIISATLVNDAGFTQPFPVLEISLGDLQGRQVALRRFRPAVYLPDSVNVEAGMAPDSRVQVSLEVVDPGKSAVAFEFAFRAAG